MSIPTELPAEQIYLPGHQTARQSPTPLIDGMLASLPVFARCNFPQIKITCNTWLLPADLGLAIFQQGPHEFRVSVYQKSDLSECKSIHQ